jgi:hypothetical protein
MFIEFYAFPFNTLGYGTNVIAGGGVQPLLTDRKLVSQPQVIHIDQTTPGIGGPIYVSNCTGLSTIVEPGFPIPPCTGGQPPLPSCPSPSDFRLFSHPFQVKTNLTAGNIFDTKWSDILAESGKNDVLTNTYKLPVKILIIADGCRYENNDATIRICMDYFVDNGILNNLYGNAYCWWNQNFYPLGYFDKILVN